MRSKVSKRAHHPRPHPHPHTSGTLACGAPPPKARRRLTLPRRPAPPPRLSRLQRPHTQQPRRQRRQPRLAGEWPPLGVGKGVLLKGAAVGTFAARKAALPALVVGGAFGGAAWFGTYELVSGAMTTVLPPPANPNPRAHTAGLAAVPCTVGASAWAGWRFCPPLAPPPERLLDLAGWASCLKSVPVKHCGAGVVVSATVAAVACRVVQYRGGA